MNTVLEMPVVVAESPNDVTEQEALALLALRRTPDWEALMAAGTDPALILGAERRMRR